MKDRFKRIEYLAMEGPVHPISHRLNVPRGSIKSIRAGEDVVREDVWREDVGCPLEQRLSQREWTGGVGSVRWQLMASSNRGVLAFVALFGRCESMPLRSVKSSSVFER